MAGNTAVIHGKDAVCKYGTAGSGTTIDYIDSWSITTTLDTADSSRQEQEWKEVIPGMASWTATLTGHLLLSEASQLAIFQALIAATPGTKLTGGTALAFHINATNHYSGDSYITTFTVNSQLGDRVNFTIGVQGTGVLTQTVA